MLILLKIGQKISCYLNNSLFFGYDCGFFLLFLRKKMKKILIFEKNDFYSTNDSGKNIPLSS